MLVRYSTRLLALLLPFVISCGLAGSPDAEQVKDQNSKTRVVEAPEGTNSAGATAESRERNIAVAQFATERLWLWQKRLNLQDWNISVVVVRASDLKPRTLGNIHWDADKKKAVIRVLDPVDYNNMPTKDMLADIEFTVVHELIHLELSSLPRSEASRSEEEHAVNQIARALLELDRKR
jgi:hypothetical protein